MKILNKSNNIIVADNAGKADNIITRFIGLLNKSSLEQGEGLLILPCNSIHSFGMKFNFDAVFLDKKNQVIHLIKNMPSGKMSPIVFKAHSVLELPAFTIDQKEIKIGDILEIM